MNCKPLISGVALIEIERSRYDELVSQEEELYRLRAAISKITTDSFELNFY